MRLTLATAVFAALVAAMPATAAAPGRLQVTALEFQYRLSRPQLRSGRWSIIELVNLGQDEHDLTLQRVGGTKMYRLPKALPGQRQIINLRLKPGAYKLSCSLADHAALGMRATLRVRRR